jgi:hypothetical protein
VLVSKLGLVVESKVDMPVVGLTVDVAVVVTGWSVVVTGWSILSTPKSLHVQYWLDEFLTQR